MTLGRGDILSRFVFENVPGTLYYINAHINKHLWASALILFDKHNLSIFYCLQRWYLANGFLCKHRHECSQSHASLKAPQMADCLNALKKSVNLYNLFHMDSCISHCSGYAYKHCPAVIHIYCKIFSMTILQRLPGCNPPLLKSTHSAEWCFPDNFEIQVLFCGHKFKWTLCWSAKEGLFDDAINCTFW